MLTSAKRILLSLIFLAVLACSSSLSPSSTTQNETTISNSESFYASEIVFTTQTEAKKMLATFDEFSQSLSLFDIASKTGGIKAVTEQDYLDYAAKQALEWTSEEIEQIRFIIKGAEVKAKALGLDLSALPKTINFIKSTTKEEGGAMGYTRGSYIVVRPPVDEHLFVHELFHVFSRVNAEKRDELYQTINFKKCNRIELPAALINGKITNPDAPFLEHYLTAEINGEKKDVVFVIYADKPYSGGSFFNYLNLKMMEVDGEDDNKRVVLEKNKPILHSFSETNLTSYIGSNTDYVLHPEEILAEHFAFLVQGTTVPEPAYLEAMKEVFK